MGDPILQFLHEPERQLWTRYLDSEKQGLRQEMLVALSEFIDAVETASSDHRTAFSEAYCRALVDDGPPLRLREPLFKRVIGPFLIAAYHNGHRKAPWWMSHMVSHFINMPVKGGLAGIPRLSEYYLLKEALSRDPDNAAIKLRLIADMADDFDYVIHELPTGVLYGQSGASVDECAELLADLDEFCRLASDHCVLAEYSEDIQEWKFHFSGYADYLTNRGDYRNYEHYIECHESR